MGKRVKVVVQKWEEVEVGWGRRPDGYSIHLTEADRVGYVEAYWRTNPDPDKFSCPSATPYEATVAGVVMETMTRDHGTRLQDNHYPGDGGPDGWFESRDCMVFLERIEQPSGSVH